MYSEDESEEIYSCKLCEIEIEAEELLEHTTSCISSQIGLYGEKEALKHFREIFQGSDVIYKDDSLINFKAETIISRVLALHGKTPTSKPLSPKSSPLSPSLAPTPSLFSLYPELPPLAGSLSSYMSLLISEGVALPSELTGVTPSYNLI